MTTLEAAQRYVTLRRSGSRYTGPCPVCGGSQTSDKFFVNPVKDDMHCFACGLHGDAITLLRKVEGMSCPDAHEAAGRSCSNRSCPAWDKCRLGARANGETPKKQPRPSLNVPRSDDDPAFVPGPAEGPEQVWQQQAAQLIEKAHDNLLDNQEQIDYLTRRGIPIAAIRAGRLGYLPENRYPARESWGLPPELKADGKKKKMFIPSGIMIPFFDADRQPHRIRIRRSDPRAEDPRYYWLPGSGNDVPVIGGSEHRGVVVVESDLDAFMIRWQCRDLDVCVIPLGTCNAKPKGWAMQALDQAKAILVAHDFEPRFNAEKQKHENPGGKGARWWLQQFKRAKRWPVPEGKDPGEYFEQGGDVRAWVLEGLPPVFHVAAKAPEKSAEKPAAPILPQHVKGQTVNGHDYVIADRGQDVNRLRLVYPGAVIFMPDEIRLMKGLSQDVAEKALLYKKHGGLIGEFVVHLSTAKIEDIDLVNSAAQIFETRLVETRAVDHTTENTPLPDEPEAKQEEIVW